LAQVSTLIGVNSVVETWFIVIRLPIPATKFISSTAIAVSLFCLGTTGGALAKSAAPEGHTFSGYSHHYADRFHGRRTASGQAHDKFKLTAAHRTLPFGTHLHVTNERNGKSCVVVVNDRGPFGSQSLVLDVSKAAAHKLGFPGGGKIKVSCKVIDPKAGAIALKELEPDRLAIAEKIASTGQKKTASAVNVKPEQNQIAKVAAEPQVPQKQPVVTKPQPKIEIAAKPQTVNTLAHSATAHAVAPPTIEIAAKPLATSTSTHPTIAHAVAPASAHLKPSAPEAPSHGTFLLVINDTLDGEPALKTAEYSPAKSHNSHSAYAPTVFMKVDEAAGSKNADKNRAGTPAITDNKILM
jgi:rare lipoprotein A